MTAGRQLVVGDPVVALGRVGVVDDGAVIVEAGRIVEVGPREVLAAHGPFESTLGSESHVVLPGFVNAHYHSECWTAPGFIDEIFELGNLYVGSGLIETDLEIITLLASYGLAQALKGGQTTTIDAFYGRPSLPLLGAEAILGAYESLGMRTSLALTLRDQNRYTHMDDNEFLGKLPAEIADEVRQSPLGYAWPIDEMVTVFDELHSRWHGKNDQFRIILAPDWTPAVSDDLYRRCRRMADEYATTITSHVLETRSELMWNVDISGKSAVRRLADLGVLGPDFSFSHFVWATDEDIAVCADHGVTAVHCVGSNIRTSVGLCRLRDLMEAGVTVAFGTDGASVGDREDFLEEVRVASYLQRQPDRFAEHRLDSLEVISATSQHAVPATGFGPDLGTLEVGSHADLVLLDSSRVRFPRTRFPRERILDVILDRADASDISTVMIGGEVVVSNGKVLTIDEARLIDRIAEMEDRLYRPTPEAARRRELAATMRPIVQELCEDWYARPITEPASVLNTRHPPGV